MIVLEALYDSVEAHLRTHRKNWERFSRDFQSVFDADFLLYRVTLDPVTKKPVDFTNIATSNQTVMNLYMNNRIYENNVISESELVSLEPVLRSEVLPDEDFRKTGKLYDFMIANGVFHSMVVPAILADGSYAGFVVWRDESRHNFNSLEKQRLALFMRHLLTVVDGNIMQNGIPVKGTDKFSRRWGLTQAESDILEALIAGRSLKQISKDSGRTYGTVRWHVQNILEKCQVSSQKELLHQFYRLIHH